MSELSPDAKDLLAAARPALGPDGDAISRVRAGVAIAIAGAAPAAAAAASGASHAAPAAATTAAKAGVAVATKLVAATLITGAIATMTVLAVHHHAGPPPAPIEQVAARPVPVPVPVPDPAAPSAAPEIVIDRPPAAPPKPHVAMPHISLGREAQLIADASAALDSDDLVTAREQLRLYDQETAGHGQMIEDRAELEVELQCKLGDASSSATLEKFLRRFPNTSYRRKLASVCSTNQ